MQEYVSDPDFFRSNNIIYEIYPNEASIAKNVFRHFRRIHCDEIFNIFNSAARFFAWDENEFNASLFT